MAGMLLLSAYATFTFKLFILGFYRSGDLKDRVGWDALDESLERDSAGDSAITVWAIPCTAEFAK